ncbi:hypothetical protein [Lysobacter panacisoli]|uniref:Apea-like HEPN domain-containing protein n=1 Tax=Lysobacter panacisoli TaxID=1255263 RepID=A0ABP9LRN2_9GAMM|nr:hypothetical protein [Lysobacter panacisoli]
MGIWRPQVGKWRNFAEKEALLLFAQSLIELLFDHTVDSFKARALNLHSLTRECMSAARRVVSGRMKQGALSPLLEELNYRIGSGPVTGVIDSGVLAQYRKAIGEGKKSDPKRLVLVLGALQSELEGYYWEAICSSIRTEVGSGKCSRRIVELADVFISEAEYRGWDRNYIYGKARWYFFQSRNEPSLIDGIGALDEFLRIFESPVEKAYTCLFRASESINKVEEISRRADIDISTGAPTGCPTDSRSTAFLSKDNDLPMYVKIDGVKAFDEVSARKAAERRLQFIVNLYRFQHHEYGPRWSESCLVYEAGALKRSLIRRPDSPMHLGNNGRFAVTKISASDLTEILIGGFLSPPSKATVFNLLEYHRVAIEATTPENQLLDLWAGIEGFAPAPIGDQDRIVFFMDMVLPALTLTYIEKHVHYLSESFRAFDESVVHYIEANGVGDSYLSKCASILCCVDKGNERKELLAQLSGSPLLTLRAQEVIGKFASANNLHAVLESRRKWVGWQIQRIYSARNGIIHNAQSLPHLPTLVENLHGYFDTLVAAVIRYALSRKAPTTIGATLHALHMHEAGYLADIKKCSAIDSGNFLHIVFGARNPLAPGGRGFL